MRNFGDLVELRNPAFVHETALLYGKVVIAEGASVWPYAVMRGETREIIIGRYSNVQDFVMIHEGDGSGTYVGDYCSIAHHATLHGCTLGDNCLVGINATIMDRAVIGENCVIAGHSIVPQDANIPANSIVAGVPGRVVKERNNWVENRLNAWLYQVNGAAFANGDHRRWSRAEHRADMAAEKARLVAEFETLYGNAEQTGA